MLGLFNLALGVAFLLVPSQIGASCSLMTVGIQGLVTMRADFSAFFLTTSLFAFVAALTMRSATLRVLTTLLGTALTGRFVSIAVDGLVATTVPPMIAEAAMIAVLVLAYRQFGRDAGPVD